MGGLIDLNTTEDDETPSSGSLSPSSSSTSVLSASGISAPGSASSSSVCLELWHACAGPLISLPKRGSVVVYFPQGHLEQVSDFSGVAAAYDLPPHVFCRVVDVKLHVSNPYMFYKRSLYLVFSIYCLCLMSVFLRFWVMGKFDIFLVKGKSFEVWRIFCRK